MSKSNFHEDIVNLFKEINKKEKNIEESKKSKNDDSEKYKKVNKLIKEFVEKKNSSKEKSGLIDDVVRSLKIINIAYENNSKNDYFNKYLSEKENITNLYLKKYHEKKKLNEKNLNEKSSFDDDDYAKDFEIITSPALNGIIEECLKIQKLLSNNKFEEENEEINKLNDNISQIIIEANKLKNKKLIDDEAIKKLVDQIKAIKKEYDKTDRKKKIIESRIYKNI